MPLDVQSMNEHNFENHQKILVVDDSEAVREALKNLLERFNFDVVLAGNAEEALKSAVRMSPDLILSDIMMPNGDGWFLQKEIKNSADLCEVPFVFITAVGSEDQRRHALEVGADAYLRKPLDPQDLISTIKGKLSTADKRKKSVLNKLQQHHKKIIHTLSHEFRTPLVSILTGADLLIDQYKNFSPSQVEDLIKTIYEGGKRLERLVNDFMTLQQIDLGQASWQSQNGMQHVPIMSLIESAVSGFKESISDSGAIKIELNVEMDRERPVMVNIFELHVSNALQRLLSNAYKFNKNQKKIAVTVLADNKKASIVVRDFGAGIKEREQLSHLGEMFMQINRDGCEQQGCGVGITIARYLIELNGGTLEFSSPQEGEGLEARVSFDLVSSS
jgi:two-component system, sensor histidine kinase and response regulator